MKENNKEKKPSGLTEQPGGGKERRGLNAWLWDAREHPERFDFNIQALFRRKICPAVAGRWNAMRQRLRERHAARRREAQRWLAAGGGRGSGTGALWQQFTQNLENWAWYHRERPDWYDIDIQTWVKRHCVAPVRREIDHLKHLRHAKRQKKFPETEHRIGQFFLFILGSIPRLTGAVRERLLSHRKSSSAVHGSLRMKFERLKLRPIVFLGGATGIAVIAVLLSLYTLGTTAVYDGVELGTVSGRGVVNEAVAQIEEITRKTLNDKDYEVDQELLDVRSHVVRRARLTEPEVLQEHLSDQIGLIKYGYTLSVDDEIIAATTYPGALEELLEQQKASYFTENTVECGFVEDVKIEEGYVPRKYVMNLGYIARKLNDTKAGEVTYTVKGGDVWSEIAAKNNMSNKDLLRLNPGYDPAVLQVGDELTISNAVPYLTVVNVERQSRVQNIPYEVKYKKDPSMYEGDSRVLRKGSYGKADVTANVTYVNGEEIDKETVASVTLREPEAELQARGTKKRPTWHPTGHFRWPCNGVITSYFGYRDAGVAGASSYHEGIDIGNYTGAPVWATDGGTVVYAGWGGGYGYLVKIDHGNGFVSYYAHLSSIGVSVGDHVYKGQQIANMGSTGISSGPHLHFGLLKNDTWVDPLDYLS